MQKVCKWYYACPIKRYNDEGKLELASWLEHNWIEQYCLVGYTTCIRLQMVERGEPHPDNLLSNGAIRKDLK